MLSRAWRSFSIIAFFFLKTWDVDVQTLAENYDHCMVKHREEQNRWPARKNSTLALEALWWLEMQETLKTEHLMNMSGSNALSLLCLAFLFHFPTNPPTCFNSLRNHIKSRALNKYQLSVWLASLLQIQEEFNFLNFFKYRRKITLFIQNVDCALDPMS